MRCLLCLVLLLLAGCGRGEIIDRAFRWVVQPKSVPVEMPGPDGRSITIPPNTHAELEVQATTVRQPSGATTPAQLRRTSDGMDAATGAGDGPTALSIGTPILIWAGIIIGVLAVVVMIARRWYPMIPPTAGPMLGGLAAALIIAPSFLERYLWIVALGVAGLIGIYLWRLLQRGRQTQQRAEQTEAGIDLLRKEKPELWPEVKKMLMAKQNDDVQLAIAARNGT